jgi:hypothetical protein
MADELLTERDLEIKFIEFRVHVYITISAENSEETTRKTKT